MLADLAGINSRIMQFWTSENNDVKRRAGNFISEGYRFTSGLFEQSHGADIYAPEMNLTPQSQYLK